MVQGEVKKGARWAPICQTRDASYFNGPMVADISRVMGSMVIKVLAFRVNN